MKVYLAIPNYNMAVELPRIVASAQGQGYAHIYILDDASTDDSAAVAARLAEGSATPVTYVSAARNVGAGFNRNKILKYHTAGIVHFMDADTELRCQNAAASIRQAFTRHPDAAVIGFQVYNADGSQYGFNFGTLSLLSAFVPTLAWSAGQRVRHPAGKRLITAAFRRSWRRRLWLYAHMEDAGREQQVGTVVECNMAVRLEDFARADGFTNEMRFHEIYDLARKLKVLGRTIWHVPEVPAYKYDETDVRTSRFMERRKAEAVYTKRRLTGEYRKYRRKRL